MESKIRLRKGALIRISEIYQSVQGEGFLTGVPSVFARTSGCNLRCWFCDTPYSSWRPEGDYLTATQVAERVLAFSASHVVLTGGEPMIYGALPELCASIAAANRHITIETAATIYQSVPCDLISISPKLSSSAPRGASAGWIHAHEHRRKRVDIILRLMSEHAYQLKFVVDTTADAEEVLRFLDELVDYDGQRVLLMPQGITTDALDQQAQWLVPWCSDHHVRYCSRAHIHWYGNTRGT